MNFKIGDIIIGKIDWMYCSGVVTTINGELGLFFPNIEIHQNADYFIPLKSNTFTKENDILIDNWGIRNIQLVKETESITFIRDNKEE